MVYEHFSEVPAGSREEFKRVRWGNRVTEEMYKSLKTISYLNIVIDDHRRGKGVGWMG